MASAGNRSRFGSVGWCVAMALPAAAAFYLIVDKQRSLADAAPMARAQHVAPEEPVAAERIAVEPRYADPDLLKQKQRTDAALRPKYEAARRLAEAREALRESSGRHRPPPAPTPEPPPQPAAAAEGPPPSPPRDAQAGPRIYGLPQDDAPAPPRPAAGTRRR